MAVDYLLTIQGVQGESTDLAHPGWIRVDDWSFGVQQMGQAMYSAGHTVGRASPQDFRIVKMIDVSSPVLMVACATGKHFDSAQLIARKAGDNPQEYMTVTFKELIVSAYDTLGSASSDIIPRDEITFNFAELQIVYRQQLANGTLGGAVPGAWDFRRNQLASITGTSTSSVASSSGSSGLSSSSPAPAISSGPKLV